MVRYIMFIHPIIKDQRTSPAFTGLNEAYYGEGNTGDWWNVPEPRVQPGDVILIHAGLYKGNANDMPIRWRLIFTVLMYSRRREHLKNRLLSKAAGDGEVIFDGDGAYASLMLWRLTITILRG